MSKDEVKNMMERMDMEDICGSPEFMSFFNEVVGHLLSGNVTYQGDGYSIVRTMPNAYPKEAQAGETTE